VLGGTDALLVDPAARTDALDAAVTHHHPDHVGAVAEYARRGATVWARNGRTDAFATAAGVDPDRRFRDGTAIGTGDGAVQVVDTPRHAPEHVAFLVDDAAVVGDLAVAEGSVAVPAPEGDMRACLSSLRRLLSHRLDRERRVEAAVRAGADTVDAVLGAAYDEDLSRVRDLVRGTVLAHLEKPAVESRVRLDGERVRPAR